MSTKKEKEIHKKKLEQNFNPIKDLKKVFHRSTMKIRLMRLFNYLLRFLKCLGKILFDFLYRAKFF